MSEQYPRRIQTFRTELLKSLPRAPNNGPSLEALGKMPTHSLIREFVTWRMRLIPTRPRKVQFWSGGIIPSEARIERGFLEPLLKKVRLGEDLTPHLSELVHKTGTILPGARPAYKGKNIDTVLTRSGLHHFHVGIHSPANPRGRSGRLVFAEVLEREFRVVAISNHSAFDVGSVEQARLWQICYFYIARDVPAGQGFMPNPIMSSGHSLVVILFADQCDAAMQSLDHRLDDTVFIDELYSAQPMRDGVPIARPKEPSLIWYFHDLEFGILDRKTMAFFCKFSFFKR